MRLTRNIAMTLFLAAVFAVALTLALDMSFRTRLFPMVIIIPTLALVLAQLVLELRNAGRTGTGASSSQEERRVAPELARQRTLTAWGWLVSLLLAVWLIGFIPALVLFVFLYVLIEARRTLWFSAASGVGLGTFLYLVMDRQLHLLMPQGQVVRWLGL